MNSFPIRGFNPCESLLRHTPEQLRHFLRRMKTLQLNTIIIHYDYGWKRYQKLILEECQKAGIEIILMTFGPRTFLSYSDWKPQWFSKQENGQPFTTRLECETWPCAFEPECLEAFDHGARQWLRELPPEIKHIHMRAGDGYWYCKCPRCRVMPTEEKWQPFVQIFVRAVQEERSDLKFETDVYVQRYRIPEDRASFAAMDHIMYDTFFRTSYLPLGSREDHETAEMLPYTASEKVPDSPTVNSYHAARIRDWASAYPGKVYMHENVMGQSNHGIFYSCAETALKDLEFYRSAGIQGVCYEAFEPGYSRFADFFELMAKAMRGEEVEYQADEFEQILRQESPKLYVDRKGFPLEKYITDPLLYRQVILHQDCENRPTPENLREYAAFGFEHEDVLDSLMIGFNCARTAWRNGMRFENVSERALDMVSRRKLWDFMEDIPLSEDPRKVCRETILELMKNLKKA